MKLMIYRFTFICFFLLRFEAILFAQSYQTNSDKCYFNPQIPSLSEMNLCVGLVASKKTVDWSLPRKILFVNFDFESNTDPTLLPKQTNLNNQNLNHSVAIVTAMGSWNKNEGQVWKLEFNKGLLMSSTLIFNKTDRTHGLRQGLDGWIYYADSTKIYRFKLNNPLVTQQIVISNLPDSYKNQNGESTPSSHPLKEFIFLKNGDMVVNVGAPSNDCSEEFKLSRACYQRDQQAELRKYKFSSSSDSYTSSYEVIARGLRNSMGLLYNPIEDVLYQAENAADNYGTPDELNLIDPYQLANTQDFGWPFCFGNESFYTGYKNFRNFCVNTARSPLILFPAHVAPLDIRYYQGKMFQELNNSILVSWHGHRPSGSKVAIYKADSMLRPLSDYSNTQPHLNPLQLLSLNWANPIPNGHPKGRPVGLDFDKQGAIYIIDDQNNSLLVVAKKNSNISVDTDLNNHTNINTNLAINLTDFMSEDKIQNWPIVYEQTLKKFNCQSCHSDVFVQDNQTTLYNLIRNNWINPRSNMLEDQKIWIRINGLNGTKIMPPAPAPNLSSNSRELQLIQEWIVSK